MKSSPKKNRDKEARTLAAIDIGSNSIRMVIAQVLPNGELEILERLQRAVRLGQDTFRRGRIRGQTMRAAIIVLRDFLNVLKTYNVPQIRAVATSAVREASNADTFIDRILVATGLEVIVIPATEESRLTVTAVRHALDKTFINRRRILIVEVGGGSTIINLLDKGEISSTHSLAIGSIRTQEALATSSETQQQASKLIEQQVSSAVSAVSGLMHLKKIQTFIAIGGDARWATGQVGKNVDKQQLKTISKKNLDNLIKQYEAYSPDELAKSLKLPFSDAETLTPALLVYSALLNVTKAQELYVSDVTMRDGLLLDLYMSVSGREDKHFSKEVLNSAEAIAHKYQIDLKHAKHVKKLSTQLYDYLKAEQWLNIENRLLLQVSAILHEIGIFVSSRAHHKHSYYLIANSEIFGLNTNELEMVANISRYHRRSRPKTTHPDYIKLPRNRRMIVSKLAAVLRVADALDVNRNQQVRNVKFRIEDEELIITVSNPTDLTLERRSLASKSDMFEDIYGLRVRLE